MKSTYFFITLFIIQPLTLQAQKKTTIQLSEFSNDIITLRVGQKCKFQFNKHISVGFDASFQISDETILYLKKEKMSYNNLFKYLSRASGADGGKATWIFKALNLGNATLKIQETFRGEVRKTYIFSIKVIK